MITKSFDEIVQSFLTFLVSRNDLMDIKPTSIVRTMIDSIANEIATINAELENVRLIQSVLNAGSMTVTDMDNLAANFGVTRKAATFATVDVTFFLQREPRQDITIPQGTIVATGTDPNTSFSAQFATQQTITMFADRINSYFNPATSLFEITTSAVALVPGSAGNIPPNSLSRATRTFNSGSDIVLATNKNFANGGADDESNTDLATRLFVSISGINVGTKDGYKSTALAIPGINDAIVVGAGDAMMVRDLNSIGEHIGGKVDIYIQGQNIEQSQDRVPFSLQQKFGQPINLIEGSNFEFFIPDSDLITSPLVSVERVYTIIPNPIFQIKDQINLLTPDNTISGEISVTIVSPLNSTTVDGGIDVTIRAFKATGQITKVNLIINETDTNPVFFENSTGLYTFTLNTAQYSDGLLELKAEAYDERNKKAVTNPIQIRVQNLKDISVRILSPNAGTTITGTTNIRAFAFSSAGITATQGVEIRYNGGRWLPMNVDIPKTQYTFPLAAVNFNSGLVKIEVRATDNRQRTAYSLPRYLIVENSPANIQQNNAVRSISIGSIVIPSNTINSRDRAPGDITYIPPVTTYSPPSVLPPPAGSPVTADPPVPVIAPAPVQTIAPIPILPAPPPTQLPNSSAHAIPVPTTLMKAGGDFNLARLVNPSDPNFGEDDAKYQSILDDKQSIVNVTSHLFDPHGEWVGTAGLGFYFSSVGQKGFDLQIHSGNTHGLLPKDDTVNAINNQQHLVYIGTNGGVLMTTDRSTYYRMPLPTDKSVLSIGFINFS